jgi:hypothetical protein
MRKYGVWQMAYGKKIVILMIELLLFTCLASIIFANGATPTVYVSIQYTIINVHVNMPGQWMVGDVKITTIATHTPVDIQFTTSGNLSSGSNFIPTYYQIYDGNNMSYVPSQPLNSNDWQMANDLNNFNITRGIGNNIFKIWFAMDVSRNVPKGNYSAWIQMSIAPHP